MYSAVLPKEFIAKERSAVVIEAIDGLGNVQRRRQLSPTEAAALNALVTLYARSRSTRDAVITAEAIARPVAIAHAAMDARLK